MVRKIRIGNRTFVRKGIGDMRRFVAGLPFLLLIFPIPHIWLVGRVTPPSDQWQFRDVGGAFLLLFEIVFVSLVLVLLKLPWIRLRFKWAGLMLLLIVTGTLMLNSNKGALTIAYLSGWLLLLVLSALWLRSQRAYLD